MKKLIINADDFGYSRAVTYGILDSYKTGILTSTTMMMNTEATEHAVEAAKENPTGNRCTSGSYIWKAVTGYS